MRYDQAELPRLCQWNSRLAVHIVQRRIYHWTKNGYPSMVSGEDGFVNDCKSTYVVQRGTQ